MQKLWTVITVDSKYDLVFITWLDITATAGWEHPDEVEPIEVHTIGWLYSKDDRVVKVGNSLGEDGTPYGISAFPRGCITNITFLDARPLSTITERVTSPGLSSQPKQGTATSRRSNGLDPSGS